jgi:hypothetical protein
LYVDFIDQAAVVAVMHDCRSLVATPSTAGDVEGFDRERRNCFPD